MEILKEYYDEYYNILYSNEYEETLHLTSLYFRLFQLATVTLKRNKL